MYYSFYFFNLMEVLANGFIITSNNIEMMLTIKIQLFSNSITRKGQAKAQHPLLIYILS
jgi:hypothetical protein